jgi:uncharacterized protein YdiU (UPF0061 family)
MNSEKRTKKFANLKFANSYVDLPSSFYEEILPAKISNPVLIDFNESLGKELNLDPKAFYSQKGYDFLAGNYIADGSKPIALAYAGHQFGNFVPSLGDGRAILLGEIIVDSKRYDIQLKGSGKTKFSRNGDGKAALGPVIREYIISEAMYNLGIKTTRSLAVVKTGEYVQREKMLPGAILTRVASSHIRVGTFEYFAARSDIASIKKLADYVINRHFKYFKDTENQYLQLLDEVVLQQAKLIASWMSVGFIHGVMNTDNCLIIGETIDYGPCAFMDEYNPNKVFSSIDTISRYAYANQPFVGYWNLARFAQAILPLLDDNINKALDKAEESLNNYYVHYKKIWLNIFSKKIAITNIKHSDEELINQLLQIMHKNKLDFTNIFSNLYLYLISDNEQIDICLQEWVVTWKNRLNAEEVTNEDKILLLQKNNPVYIPRNHLVEKVINKAVEEDDYSDMKMLIKILEKPYDYNIKDDFYTKPPKPEERVLQTFCGT